MLRSRRSLVAAAAAAVLAAPGCRMADRGVSPAPDSGTTAEQARQFGYASDQARPQAPAAAPSALAQASAKAASTGTAAAPGLASAFAALKLIRTAQVTVEVAKFDQAAQEVAHVAESFGGYVAESQQSRGHQDHQAGSITIRVPSERFAAALGALKGLGKVKTESVSTQDVTKAYTDLETRLRVKRDTADRLRDLLRTRTAALSDVLSAERELARVTEEIEQMEGERRFYDQQVAFSTIALSLFEPQALVEPGVFAPIGQALRNSAEVLAQSVAALVFVVAALGPWALVVYVVWRTVKALRSRRRAAAARS